MMRKLFEPPLLFILVLVLIILIVAVGNYADLYSRQHPAPSPTLLSATCIPALPATCVPAQPVMATPVPTEVPEVEPTLKPILDTFNVSYYTTEEDDITWSGVEPHYGIVACPSIFPFGTRFVILTRRWANWTVRTEEFICEDRFASPRYFGLDIWYPSREAASEWPLGTYWVLILFDDRPLEEQEIVVDRNPFIPKTLDTYYDEERRKWTSPADREEE